MLHVKNDPEWVNTFLSHTRESLSDSEEAVSALYGRGVTDDQMALYELGLLNNTLPEGMPDSFQKWWTSLNKTDMHVFPVRGFLGNVVAFQFRSIHRDTKNYTDFVVDPTQPVAFGVAQSLEYVWQHRKVWLCEGVYDLFPVQRQFAPVWSVLTAGVSPDMGVWLKRLAPTVFVCFDNDAAGQRANQSFIKTYGGDMDVRLVQCPSLPYKDRSTKDVGELWEVGGDPLVYKLASCTKGF